MKKLLYISLAALMLLGCARKNESGKEAQKSYRNALNDSIRKISMEIDSCHDMAATLSDKVNNLLPEFRPVEKAREVEGYMIYQGWENRYPLMQTGVVARLSANRRLELVAVLKGGEFDRIRVNVPSATAETETVVHDQALNYRQNGLNTVLFTGAAADSVARLIADNELNPITVTFLNGDKATGTWKMGNENAKMITMTYLLYSSHVDQLRLEKRSLLLGEKLKLLRLHDAEMKSKGGSTEEVMR